MLRLYLKEFKCILITYTVIHVINKYLYLERKINRKGKIHKMVYFSKQFGAAM